MIFAIAMDYTVFLLASAKEHYEHSGDPKDAMVGSLAHSGRVIFAAGAVMVAVFFTFALSGPLPPKEMGIVLGRRRPAGRVPGPSGAAPGPAPPHRPGRVVDARAGSPGSCPPSASRTTDPHLTIDEGDHHVRAVTCKTCGKTTWAGCGQHVARSRPASRRTTGALATRRPLARVAACSVGSSADPRWRATADRHPQRRGPS